MNGNQLPTISHAILYLDNIKWYFENAVLINCTLKYVMQPPNAKTANQKCH